MTRTVYHRSECISHLGSKIWDIIPSSFKKAVSLNNFKKLIKKRVTQACPCKLCKKYIPGIGFVKSLPSKVVRFYGSVGFLRFPVFYGIFRNQIVHIHRVGYRIAKASWVEHLVVIVQDFLPFIIITRSSI